MILKRDMVKHMAHTKTKGSKT